jgi:hypothetical protein
MEMSDQLHAPVALSPVKKPYYPLDRMLGGLNAVVTRKVFVPA